jgi:hypothetical protein
MIVTISRYKICSGYRIYKFFEGTKPDKPRNVFEPPKRNRRYAPAPEGCAKRKYNMRTLCARTRFNGARSVHGVLTVQKSVIPVVQKTAVAVFLKKKIRRDIFGIKRYCC